MCYLLVDAGVILGSTAGSPWYVQFQSGQLDMAAFSLVTSEGGSLVAGTLVHAKSGMVPIEKIQVGDWVLSQPESKGKKNSSESLVLTHSIARKFFIFSICCQTTLLLVDLLSRQITSSGLRTGGGLELIPCNTLR